MKNKIRHVGIIESIKGDNVIIRIVQSSACASCKAAKQCHASESKEKRITVNTISDSYSIGQEVIVKTSARVGVYAVCLSILLPLIIVISTLLVLTSLNCTESTVAVLSVCSLIPYYALLFLFRDRVKRNVVFEIEE